MKLLGRKKNNAQTGAAGSAASPQAEELGAQTSATQPGTTAPKGKPTPKRNEAARRRGPVAPAPMTAAEARRRRKELGGPKLTRQERKAEKIERRLATADRREKMMAGEDDYLLPRDKGPVRRFARDVVDGKSQQPLSRAAESLVRRVGGTQQRSRGQHDALGCTR